MFPLLSLHNVVVNYLPSRSLVFHLHHINEHRRTFVGNQSGLKSFHCVYDMHDIARNMTHLGTLLNWRTIGILHDAFSFLSYYFVLF